MGCPLLLRCDIWPCLWHTHGLFALTENYSVSKEKGLEAGSPLLWQGEWELFCKTIPDGMVHCKRKSMLWGATRLWGGVIWLQDSLCCLHCTSFLLSKKCKMPSCPFSVFKLCLALLTVSSPWGLCASLTSSMSWTGRGTHLWRQQQWPALSGHMWDQRQGKKHRM